MSSVTPVQSLAVTLAQLLELAGASESVTNGSHHITDPVNAG